MQCKGPIYLHILFFYCAKIAQIQPDYRFFAESRHIYSVIHISIHPSKELCSKMAPGEVGVVLP